MYGEIWELNMTPEPSSVLPIISVCAVIFFGIAGLLWHIYSKNSTTRENDLKSIYDKMENNTTQCISKYHELKAHFQSQVDQTRNMIIDHKLEAINRQDANILMEEKLQPIRVSIQKQEVATDKLADKFDIGMDKLETKFDAKFDATLHSLSEIKGCLENRRRGD